MPHYIWNICMIRWLCTSLIPIPLFYRDCHLYIVFLTSVGILYPKIRKIGWHYLCEIPFLRIFGVKNPPNLKNKIISFFLLEMSFICYKYHFPTIIHKFVASTSILVVLCFVQNLGSPSSCPWWFKFAKLPNLCISDIGLPLVLKWKKSKKNFSRGGTNSLGMTHMYFLC